MPEELRVLPPGRYVLEPWVAPPSAEEEDGIADAINALDAGQGIPLEQMMAELEDGPEVP